MERKPSQRMALQRPGDAIDFRMMLAPGRVVDLEATEKTAVLERLIEVTCTSDRVADREVFRRAIFEREKMLSTDVGHGIGIPHVKIPAIRDFVMSIGRSPAGIDYGARDGKPVRLVFMIGANDSQSTAFLKVLARMMMRLKNAEFRDAMLDAETPELVYRLMTTESPVA